MSFLSKQLFRTILLTSLPLSIAAGCAVEDSNSQQPQKEKADRWNGANDPSNMGRNYIYNWDELNVPELQEGASEITPWPDTYWPMVEDGYNHRWQYGKLSPMELYDKVFNAWTPSMGFSDFLALTKFEEPGTSYNGEYYDNMGPATAWAHEGGNERARVLTSPDGDKLWDEDSEDEFVDWGGLQSWFGHCHAWAPASFVYPEPKHAVSFQGETFEVADIKALIEATMEGGRSMFLGGRCNAEEAKRDEHGRIIATQCRDTNAGAFHVVTLNRMGIRKSSFVIDATYDAEVWNQPVRDYTIRMQEEVSLDETLSLLGRTDVTEYPYSDATRFVHVKMDFRYVVEGEASVSPFLDEVDNYTRTHNYNYILELDTAGNIIGGEWIDDTPHPDFMWAPYGSNDVRIGWSNIIIKQSDVQKLVDMSTESAPTVDGTSYDSSPDLQIPDDNTDGVTDTITVPDSKTIKGLEVKVNINHTYRGDLVVELVRGNERVTLTANEGGSASDVIETFNVNNFDGQDVQGDWSLFVADNAGYDLGTLNSWSLTVTD